MNGVMIAFSDDEGKIIQQGIDSTYEKFLSRVAQCRHKTRDEVHAIAQGRIWLGTKGKEIGLVDEIGGIEKATAYAAKMAKVSAYSVESYPKQKDPIQELLGNTKEEVSTRVLKTNLGDQYIYLKQLQTILHTKGIQARVPYEMIIE